MGHHVYYQCQSLMTPSRPPLSTRGSAPAAETTCRTCRRPARQSQAAQVIARQRTRLYAAKLTASDVIASWWHLVGAIAVPAAAPPPGWAPAGTSSTSLHERHRSPLSSTENPSETFGRECGLPTTQHAPGVTMSHNLRHGAAGDALRNRGEIRQTARSSHLLARSSRNSAGVAICLPGKNNARCTPNLRIGTCG